MGDYSDIKNKLVVTSGEGEEGQNRSKGVGDTNCGCKTSYKDVF